MKNDNKNIIFLKNTKKVYGLYYNRENRDKNLLFISDSFFTFLKNNKLSLDLKKGKSITNLLAENKISDEIFIILSGIAYHLRDKKLFDSISKFVLKNKKELSSKVYYRILHNMATWQSAEEKRSDIAIKYNLEVISNYKIHKDRGLYLKARHGLTRDKKLLPIQKAKDYLKIAEGFREEKDYYEEIRSLLEAGRSYLDLAKQQGFELIAFQNLSKAKEIVLRSLKEAKDLKYSNVELLAYKILKEIYEVRVKKINNINSDKKRKTIEDNIGLIYKQDRKKIKSLDGKIKELTKLIDYKSKHEDRYKESFFNHI